MSNRSDLSPRSRRCRPASRRFRPAALALPVLLAACAGGGSDVAPRHPDLTGSWVVNFQESDRPSDRARRQPPPGAPAGRREPGGATRRRVPIGLMMTLQNSVAFRIEETDSTLVLTGAEGIRRVFHPDGRERKERIPGLGVVTVKTRWKGGKLVVERKMEGGVKIVETFERSPDGRKLYVDLQVVGAARPLRFRRVYDAADDDGG